MGDRSSAVAAFEAFVTARGRALLRTAFLLTGDHCRAEDLVQTALAKTWPRWAPIKDAGREGYVRKVMLTTYIAWWRRRWTAERPSGRQAPTAVVADLPPVTAATSVVFPTPADPETRTV